MNLITKTFATTALLAAALTPATAQEESASIELLCRGDSYDGTYWASPHPSYAPLTAEHFNNAAGQEIVSGVIVSANGRMLLLTPTDITVDCEVFMDQINDTGLVKSIYPNVSEP